MGFDESTSHSLKRRKRIGSVFILILAIIAGIFIGESQARKVTEEQPPKTTGTVIELADEAMLSRYQTAIHGLEALAVKGRAPKTGYNRNQFGSGWQKGGGCDTRNRILARDLQDVLYETNSCVVLSGTLGDPYTGRAVQFQRGQGTSGNIQIDHVVALSDAWQKGAQLLSPALREQFANDGLNLLAVDGATNQNKGDGDAATWLPPNKPIRCSYAARQISVKLKYSLWITTAEKTALQDILERCPGQKLAS